MQIWNDFPKIEILHGLLAFIKYGMFCSNLSMIDSGKTTPYLGSISTPKSWELGINIKWLFYLSKGYLLRILMN